jgi:hypothetical protein
MHRTASRIRSTLPLALMGLAGCFSLGHNAPPERYYVLGAVAPSANDTAARDLDGLTVGVRRLQLPSYLATPLIVVRRGPNRITFAEFHRWGEDLAGGISRAVAGYMTGRAPVRRVAVAPWPPGERYDYLIQIDVAHFEGLAPEEPSAPPGEAHLLASWEILRQQDGAVIARGTTDYREGGWEEGDYATLVTLLDTGLKALANDLVRCLATLPAPAPPPAAGVEPVPEPARLCAARPD